MSTDQRFPNYLASRLPAAASVAAAKIMRAVARKKQREPGIPDF
ncbi:MAG: hypothetical protein ACQEQQ_05325 [Chloroflexota bacterium]